MLEKEKYEYLEPLWNVLGNEPSGEIHLKEAIEKAGLENKQSVHLLTDMTKEFVAILTKKMLASIFKGEGTLKEITDSWYFDKFMLMKRVTELKGQIEKLWGMTPVLQEMEDEWHKRSGM